MVRLPKTTAGGLSGVLTGTPDVHRRARRPTSPGTTPPGALVRALWPVLWQRSLKDLAGLGDDVYRLGSWAGRHLHPFGPLPVLRVGDLPYGVLPIADFTRMAQAAASPSRSSSAPCSARCTCSSPHSAQAGERLDRGIVGADEETAAAGARRRRRPPASTAPAPTRPPC